MVTRTIKVTRAVVAFMNAITNQFETAEYELAGTYKNEAKFLEELEGRVEPHLAPLRVMSKETYSVRVGMDLQDFYDHSVILNNETDEADEDETDEAAEADEDETYDYAGE